MDCNDFMASQLEDICRQIFPGCLIEIKYFGDVGIWLDIVDFDGQMIGGEVIANALMSYLKSDKCSIEDARAIAATRHCLRTFLNQP